MGDRGAELSESPPAGPGIAKAPASIAGFAGGDSADGGYFLSEELDGRGARRPHRALGGRHRAWVSRRAPPLPCPFTAYHSPVGGQPLPRGRHRPAWRSLNRQGPFSRTTSPAGHVKPTAELVRID